MTPAEKILWRELRASRTGVKFYRQVPLGPYIADFFCKSHALIIELDGDTHPYKSVYEQKRDATLGEFYTVLHYPNGLVLHDLGAVLADIRGAISNRTSDEKGSPRSEIP